MRRRSRLGALIVAAVVACAPAQTASTPAVATTAAATTLAPTPSPSPTPTLPPKPHVFVIVMENTGLTRALGAATIGALAKRYALFTNYHAVSRPSLPNYLAMTSGSTWDIADDNYHVLPATGIGAQLAAAGIPWRAYMDGMTAAGCKSSPSPYALKHDPFAYYGGACPLNVVPIEALDGDLASAAYQFTWITPDLCHDGHDCAIDQAGTWLAAMVTRITTSRAWQERGTLFIAWDEGDGGDANLVPLIAATSRGIGGAFATPYDHYSLLATIEDIFGVARLANAAQATPIAEVLAGN